MPVSKSWALAALGLALYAGPALAQLGSVANPPPQNLFNFGQPPRLDPGTGTYAERRARLLHDRNGVVHRTARPTRPRVPYPR